MKKLANILVICMVMVSSLIIPTYAIEFTDLTAEHWAYEYITTLVNSGVVNGYDDGTYKPSGTITRGEFLKLVVSSCIPRGTDVNELPTTMQHWAAGYVAFAEKYEIINKNSITESNINEPITRIEMARMVSKADIIMKNNEQQFNNKTNFSDVANLNMEDDFMLRHAVARGLITGYEDGTFGPSKTMTRAEAATMIYRFTR